MLLGFAWCGADSSWELQPQCMDQIKGWARSSAVLTILLAANELDQSDAGSIEKLKPLFHALDKCWMIPVHVT